jgi:hypothetical protein
MRRHTIAVPSGTTAIITLDYLQAYWSLQFVPIGGSTYTVQFTADDPNNTEQSPGDLPTWFAFPAALTAATTAQFFPNFTQNNVAQPISAIQVAVSTGGTVYVTVLQASGDSSV